MKKKVVVILFIVIIVILSFIFIKDNTDTIKYKNKTYKLLKYSSDIFTYNFNNTENQYLEVDAIHLIKHDKFDIVYFNGDLFVLDKQVNSTIKYYSNDDNYNWYVDFGIDDEIIRKDILLSKEDIKYLYKLEDAKKNKTIIFTGGAFYKMFGFNDRFFKIIDTLLDISEDVIVLIAGRGSIDTMSKKLSLLKNNHYSHANIQFH